MRCSRIRHNWRAWPLAAVLSLAVGLGASVALSAEKAESESDKPAPAAGKDKDKKGQDKEKQPAEEVLVITNDDLLERYGEPEPAPPPGQAASGDADPDGDPADPLTKIQQDKTASAAKQERVREAARELQAAKKELASLEKQLLATRNPYSARPELSDEEKKSRGNSDEGAAERYQRTQLLADKARGAVREAEQKLAEARTGK